MRAIKFHALRRSTMIALTITALLILAGCGTSQNGADVAAESSTTAAHDANLGAAQAGAPVPPLKLFGADGKEMAPTDIVPTTGDATTGACCSEATTEWTAGTGTTVRVVAMPSQDDNLDAAIPVEPGSPVDPEGKFTSEPMDLGGNVFVAQLAVDFPASITLIASGMDAESTLADLTKFAKVLEPLSATPYRDGFGFPSSSDIKLAFGVRAGEFAATFGNGYTADYGDQGAGNPELAGIPIATMSWRTYRPATPGASIGQVVEAAQTCPILKMGDRETVFCKQTKWNPANLSFIDGDNLITLTAWNATFDDLARMLKAS